MKYKDDYYTCIGIALMVFPPIDEFDESGLPDTEIVLSVSSINREAAERRLQEYVDDYLDDHGPVPVGHELRMLFTTRITHS